MIIDKNNLGKELKRWFSVSVILHDQIDFDDVTVFEAALEIFRTDYHRYYNETEQITQDNILLRTELQGILLYRIARIYFLNNNEEAAQKYSLLGRFLSGFEIYYSAQIGKALKINHGLGTVVGARVTIGNNALLHQNVTFGDRKGGRPVLLDNVTVYAGAKILGAITVGCNSILAANCACIHDVPENSTVAGIPAKIIQSKKS